MASYKRSKLVSEVNPMRGRHSEVKISLSAEQRKELEERSRQRTAPHCEVVRARALLMAADGQRNVTIAEWAGVDARTVANWRLEFQQRGLESLRDRHRAGRPSSFSPGGESSRCSPRLSGTRPTAPACTDAGDPTGS